MLNFVFGALVAWVALSFIETETTICGVLEFPMNVMYILGQILISPFMFLFLVFLRHTIKPVTSEAVERAKLMEDSKHLFGSVYICFDKKAKRLCNKVFLFRIKPPVISDKADSPDFFRIGVDK